MNHLPPETLGALKDRALEGEPLRAAERHLAACADCRRALEELTALEQRLAGALEHDPGEAYFESFARRVTERIASERVRAPAAAPPQAAWWRTLLAPRRLAWAASAAAVALVAVIVYDRVQESRGPLVNRALEARLEQQAPSASAPGGEAAAPATPPAQDERALGGVARAPAVARREAGVPPPGMAAKGGAFGALAPSAPLPPAREGAPAPAAAKSLPVQTLRDDGRASDRLERERGGAAAPSANLVPVAPGAREDVPVAHTRGGRADEVRFNATAGERPTDAGAKVRALKRGLATPLEGSSVSGGAAQSPGAAAAPSLQKSSLAETSEAPDGEASGRIAVSAESLSEVASETRRAADHEAAAAAWDAVSAAAPPHGPVDLAARGHAADERYAAWSLDPTARRRDAAAASLARVLELAPAGARRQRYARILDRLPR